MIKYQQLTTCKQLSPEEFWSSNECGIRAISYITNQNLLNVKDKFKESSDISLRKIYQYFGYYLQKTTLFNDQQLAECNTKLDMLVKNFDNKKMILGLLPDENDYLVIRKNYLKNNSEYIKFWNYDYSTIKEKIRTDKFRNIFHAVGFQKDTYFDCIDYQELNLNIENWFVTCIIHS